MDREYMRTYMAARRARIRSELKSILGGECARCGASEDLQFDHIDQTTKVFDISSGLTRSREELLREIEKCQLLCDPCHLEKSKAGGELGGGYNKITEFHHGTPRMKYYKKCKCMPCLIAMRLYKKKIIKIDEAVPSQYLEVL